LINLFDVMYKMEGWGRWKSG